MRLTSIIILLFCVPSFCTMDAIKEEFRAELLSFMPNDAGEELGTLAENLSSEFNIFVDRLTPLSANVADYIQENPLSLPREAVASDASWLDEYERLWERANAIGHAILVKHRENYAKQLNAHFRLNATEIRLCRSRKIAAEHLTLSKLSYAEYAHRYTEHEFAECGICMQEADASRPLATLERCQHGALYCTSCLEHHVKEKLEEHGRLSQHAGCPHPECKCFLTWNDLLRFGGSIEAATLAQQRWLETQQTVTQEFAFCRTNGCRETCFREGSSKIGMCLRCKVQRCLACSQANPVKGGSMAEGCAEHTTDELGIAVALNAGFLTRCPKCKNIVGRDTLCPSGTCRCGHNWTWEGGGKATSENLKRMNAEVDRIMAATR